MRPALREPRTAHFAAGFLAKRGAFTCGDVARLPISVLGKRFGNPGRRIWQMCRGEDPVPVETKIDPPKSLGHGKIMPPDTTNRDVIYMYLIQMAEKLGFRLRQHSLAAQKYFIRAGNATTPGGLAFAQALAPAQA